jgi:hypothetical protein
MDNNTIGPTSALVEGLDTLTNSAYARHGWAGPLREFALTEAAEVLAALKRFVADAGESQINAWRDSIRLLRTIAVELIDTASAAAEWGLVLEFQMPMEARRADAVVLLGGAVAILEFKGKVAATDADVDQTHAYARDLRSYHDACHHLPVHPVLVPTRSNRLSIETRAVFVRGPTALPQFLLSLGNPSLRPLPLSCFLAADAYRPLPNLVAAARELVRSGSLRRVHRAAAATEGAVKAVTEIAREAAAKRSRHLVLLTGVPGAGKTLVGLQVVHADLLDELASARKGRRPAAPAVFLSGNGPLVEVLQYELKGAGGGGKAFVRGVKDYVAYYEARPNLPPPEHVLVFDEAQRAYNAAMVAEKHKVAEDDPLAKSEPEHFIEFASRVPDWCLVLGLIGGGQEINRGEEAGLAQWADAIRASRASADWSVHGPASIANTFASLRFHPNAALSLDKSLRSHLASDLHKFVAYLLYRDPVPSPDLAVISGKLALDGHDLWVTRDLNFAKDYLRQRYSNDKEARFGILASSRDKDLAAFGIDNRGQKLPGFHGPWYGEPEGSPRGRSCRELNECETEFGAQGLELEGVLLGWGTDFIVDDEGRWSNAFAKRHVKKVPIRDPWQLRANAYRVLLTRARDVTVVFVPFIPELDATYSCLLSVGFRRLTPHALDPS